MSLPIRALLDLNHLINQSYTMSAKVDASAPWDAKNAAKLDQLTVQQWMDSKAWSHDGKVMYAAGLRALLCMEPSEVSFLYWLWFLTNGGGFMRLADAENGAQERKFVHGAQPLSENLAKELDVRYESPVVSVTFPDQQDETFLLRTRSGQCFKSKYIVIAVPPALYSKIHFSPSLPPKKLQLGQRMPMGSIIKTSTVYKRPFWRDIGSNGTFFSDRADDPVVYTYDDTKEEFGFYGIMGFILASQWVRFESMSYEERRDRVAKQYARIFGSDEALSPVDYLETNWAAEEYSGGCYLGAMGPGVLSRFGKELRKNVGNVHFAGTETATKWAGYMDGALQAGERAAHEILEKMSKDGEVAHPGKFQEDVPEDDEVVARPSGPLPYERMIPRLSIVFAIAFAAISVVIYFLLHLIL
eukprot:TRINITY_DN3508_c0_g1_i2.p1 TRINITY_DN3508_c0_g1~~TRINITY_DN3508_c0_g1_i2.p1  ORF type:complete len:414 (-),score=82.35 TRINITY_DN3508_c0_g1_i2:41-1282(-)